MCDKLAIIILNYNSPDLTAALARQLNGFGYTESVIVVDNLSTDDSREYLAKLQANSQITFLPNDRNAGYAAGNNLGLRFAYSKGYQYGLIVNSDIEFYSAQAIDDMIAAFEHDPSAGCVCPRIDEPGGKEASQRIFRPTAWDLSFGIFSYEKKLREATAQRDDLFGIYRAHGSCMMVRLDIMEKIGYLDEDTFLYFEEDILAEKLLANHNTVLCCGTARVLHNHSVVTKKFLKVWKMIKIYGASADIYLRNYRQFRGPARLACKYTKCLSMLKGWL